MKRMKNMVALSTVVFYQTTTSTSDNNITTQKLCMYPAIHVRHQAHAHNSATKIIQFGWEMVQFHEGRKYMKPLRTLCMDFLL